MLQKVNTRCYRLIMPFFALLFLACSSMEESQPAYESPDNQLSDIPTTLQSMENGLEADGLNEFERRGPKPTFATFNAALGSTGLASVFARNELTVFAPTDAAFAALGLNPGNVRRQEGLREILLYHVVAGTVLSTDLSEGFVPTLNGAAVEIGLSEGAKVNDADIILVDKRARNGVIHGIDEVLLPPTQNIVEIADSVDDFSILVTAVTIAGYGDLLATTENLTVFAPTNQAFMDLVEELDGINNLEELIDFLGVEGLQKVLAYHVFADGRVYSSDLANTSITMFSGDELTIDVSGPKLIDTENREVGFIATDIQATNGVIHIIDRVILPDLN
ncbi:fasciclin domain-containing protein [Mongoliibacter ruber]|uniref:Putative surface protein with fasciclin (FAS1) repeats n=1 Tax=Mongoliibacter ruber TaxID=1750599 RepID=A0A2T0WN00_9BACT|nr:fasciclin domain-containing protein [Mongoliibacter ruber]PRY88076.1 putative surface protein with fasciclin (FAS1) repeats [Mongoliibacter ruber]